MIAINEYLSTKVKLYNGFPKEKSKDKIISFLETEGFVKKADPDYADFGDYAKNLAVNYPFYIDDVKGNILYFCKGGTLTKDNPFFILAFRSSLEIRVFYSNSGLYNNDNYKTLYYDEFLDEIKRCFNWNSTK